MAVPILLWGMVMRIKAYAKINLALDITGRREDGYHLLDMVMHTISLCDILTLRQGGDGLSVTCGRTDVPCGEENTVYRAAEAFFREIGQRPNLSIEIEKRIPSQAGLAGGSADAAAALHALNRMYRAELPLETLCEIGLTVGADVPFCVWGGSARVQGLESGWSAPHCFQAVGWWSVSRRSGSIQRRRTGWRTPRGEVPHRAMRPR